MKLLIAVTSDISLRLLKGQFDYLIENGIDVHVVVSKGPYSLALDKNNSVTVHYVDMAREISLKQDLSALFKMYLVFRKVKPDITNVGTPKAALLGSICAFFTGTRRRVYTLRGLRLETTQGFKRHLLKVMEQFTILFSTEVLAISPSLITKCKEIGLRETDKMTVLGKGSSNGLDLEVFDYSYSEDNLSLFENDDFVIGYTGRLAKDKGIEELIEATLSFETGNLLLVGAIDSQHGLSDETIHKIKNHPRIYVTGFVQNPIPFYKYMDLFVLPSYREGFGNVCLEAAAARLAVVGTNVTGIKDAVVDGETGCLVADHSVEELFQAINYLRANPEVRKNYGEKGRQRVATDFQSKDLWDKMLEFYRKEM